MYSVALKQKQYPTYILTDSEKDSRLEIIPERGGLVTHWQIQDTQVLYFDAERFQDPSKSVRGGIPILFPICGNLPDDTYTHLGTAYTLKQHGFARDLPWSVVDQGVSIEQGAFVHCQLTSSPNTLKTYPFNFTLEIIYRLKGHQLTLEHTITNRSDQPMPFSLGLHPYFQMQADSPQKSQLDLKLPAETYTDQISQQQHSFDGDLDWSAPELDLAFRPISANRASATDPTTGLTVQLEYDPEFTTLVFWTVEGKSYYCLEPWSAPRNALNTGEDLITLAPHSRQTLQVTLTATLENS